MNKLRKETPLERKGRTWNPKSLNWGLNPTLPRISVSWPFDHHLHCIYIGPFNAMALLCINNLVGLTISYGIILQAGFLFKNMARKVAEWQHIAHIRNVNESITSISSKLSLGSRRRWRKDGEFDIHVNPCQTHSPCTNLLFAVWPTLALNRLCFISLLTTVFMFI